MNADTKWVNDHLHLTMRTGRKLGRTLYLVVDPNNPDSDLCVGIVDTEALAQALVAAWNDAPE